MNFQQMIYNLFKYRYSLLICLIFFINNINAQTIRVDYEVVLNKNAYITSTKSIYHLVISDYKSLYYNNTDSIDIFFNIDWYPEIIKSNEYGKLIKLTDNVYSAIIQDYFYKDYRENFIISNDRFLRKRYIIKEPINIFDWKIIQDRDTVILGYICSKATCDFRGRKYTAYFTYDLINYGGPWKFDGLPGLILSVKSDDEYFIINPLKIETNDVHSLIINPYLKEHYILDWEEFKEEVYNKSVKLLKSMKSDHLNGESTKITIQDRIEYVGFYELSSDDL